MPKAVCSFALMPNLALGGLAASAWCNVLIDPKTSRRRNVGAILPGTTAGRTPCLRMAKPGAAFLTMSARSVGRHLGERLDRLERAVALDDGHEDLVEALVVVRTVGHLQAADVERASLLDGLEKALAGRLGAGLLERGDCQPPHQVAFERDEIRLRPVGRLD